MTAAKASVTVDLRDTESVLSAMRLLVDKGDFAQLRKVIFALEAARGDGNRLTGNYLHKGVFAGGSGLPPASLWDRHFAPGTDAQALVRSTLEAGLGARDRERIARWREGRPAARRLVAFGSCFAMELATAFIDRGVAAERLQIEENINSPAANLAFLRALRAPSAHAFVEECLAGRRERIRELLGECEVVCLTLGVAPYFASKASGELFLARDYRRPLLAGELVQVLPSVPELARTIADSVAELEALAPGALRLLTLSPVPLSGSVTGLGVVSYDLLSKASLRVALDEAARQAEFVYLPSFEAVKWIAPHLEPRAETRAYGADDGETRHVSRWLVRAITGWACETLGLASSR